MSKRSATPWLAVVLIAACFAVPVIFAAQLARATLSPHDVVLGVSGPTVVSQAVAERARSDAFDVRVLKETSRPSRQVAAGLLDAAVVIDLRGTVDTLVVPVTASSTSVDAVRRRLEVVSAGYGRTLDVQEVRTARGDDTSRRAPYVLVVVWVGLGVLIAVGLSLWRGPVAATTALGALRLLGVGVAAAQAAVVVAIASRAIADTSLLGPILIGASLTMVIAWLVFSCESIFGLRGLGFAVALVVGGTAPLLTFLEPTLLPQPGRLLLPWTPHGAALRLLQSDTFDARPFDARAAAVLAVWAFIAVATLVVARRHRPLPQQ